MSALYAHAGEEVTCENGHLYGQFVRDVPREGVSSKDFVYADGTPVAHRAMVKRCHCGAKAIRASPMWGWQAHFKDGWRGSTPDVGYPRKSER